YRRLHIGEKIEEGQLLGIIDDRLARLDVDIMRSKVAQATHDAIASEKIRDESQKRYDRLRLIRERGGSLAADDEDVSVAKLQWDRYSYEVIAKKEAVNSATHELSKAQVVLQLHEIRSRVRGVLRAIHKHPGEAVKNLETLFEIEVAKDGN